MYSINTTEAWIGGIQSPTKRDKVIVIQPYIDTA